MNAQQTRALDLAKGLESTAANLSRIAGQTSPEASRWAFGQWALRKRARAKFRLADEMLFDRDGLEMASHERVAEYHGSRFPKGECVEDWTCGIGGDLVALGLRGPAFGWESDRVRAACALHNLAVHGLDDPESYGVFTNDSLRYLGGAEYAFCDPSRRTHSQRTLRLDEFMPDPRALAEALRRARLGGIKLTPMLPDRQLEEFGGSLEFVSFGGECREALIWLGSESEPGRSAVQVESGQTLSPGRDPERTIRPDRFLFEADPAAIRAHCLRALCESEGVLALADSNGYLTGPARSNSPWLRCFEVLSTPPADLKQTRAELRRLGGGTPVVKSRAQGVDVDKLRKELRGEGEEFVLIVYPEGKSRRHAICRTGFDPTADLQSGKPASRCT